MHGVCCNLRDYINIEIFIEEKTFTLYVQEITKDEETKTTIVLYQSQNMYKVSIRYESHDSQAYIYIVLQKNIWFQLVTSF